jgi:predicted outer membrane repeat protein
MNSFGKHKSKKLIGNVILPILIAFLASTLSCGGGGGGDDGKTVYYADADSDGYGNPDDSVRDESQPEGYVTDNTDCDDTDASIYPGMEEICDGVDNNCDGWIDEGFLPTTYYIDADGDGYGNPGVSQVACSQPAGYITDNSDCDDSDASIYPGAAETIDDGIDQDCDGFDDITFYIDMDGDTYGDPDNTTVAPSNAQPPGYVTDGNDCDDTNAGIHPGAAEIFDGIDNNCNGDVDEIRVPEVYETIQEAIDAASNGSVILVNDGTHTGSIDFGGKEITVKSVNGVGSTIINGGGRCSVVTFRSGENALSILEGFTITNGSGTTDGGVLYGGGIYCGNSIPTITNCTITGNSADYGGGIYCYNSFPTITDCTITGNSSNAVPDVDSTGNGGGIYCYNSSPTITKSTISDNTADQGGGGIYCVKASIPAITKSTITGNSASSGGGIHCDYSSSPTITNSTITGNSANTVPYVDSTGNGGGIYSEKSSPAITNCTISGNSAENGGGGIYCSSPYASPTITNCIIWGNTAVTSGEQIYNGGSAYINYSNIQGGWLWGVGNIGEDPLFVDSENEDYRLQPGSPCIDSGTNAGAPGDDTDGNSRPQGFGYDMGLYETASTIYSDYDGDGYTVDEGDCDDTDATKNPGALEICSDGIDQDCNGYDIACNPTIYVPSEYDTIQEAINSAQGGGVILVDNGTYYENINFLGKDITLRSEDGALNTTIDGNAIGNAVNFVYGESSSTVLDGFTIINGGNDKYGFGSGIYCYSSSPTIKNCEITANLADIGGGIHCVSSSPLITNCTIRCNSADIDGGGISCYDSNPTITKSTISGNSAENGGGISCYLQSPTITNCTIAGNTAFNGGGIYCRQSRPTITNCTIAGNSSNYGGGIYCYYRSFPVVLNSILWGDTNSSDYNEIYLYVDVNDPSINSTINITYSDIQGNWFDEEGKPYEGIIDADPLFVGDPGGDISLRDYHLQAGSPCIDVGKSAGAPGDDFDGNARPQGAGYDMGAYEY